MKNAGHVLFTLYYYYLLLLQDAKPLGKCPPWFESNKVHLHREPRAQPACGSGFNRTLRSGIFKRRVEEGPGGTWQAFSAGLPPG